jgi:hypothetical protein
LVLYLRRSGLQFLSCYRKRGRASASLSCVDRAELRLVSMDGEGRQGLRGTRVERGGQLEEGWGVCECGSTQGDWEPALRRSRSALPRHGIHGLAVGRGECGHTIGNKTSSGCARESRGVGRVSWRGLSSGGGRLAREEVVDSAPAKCSTKCCMPQHSRETLRGT